MLKTILIAGFAFALCGSAFVSAQQTQTQPGTPAQPTSSVFNRMRRFPSQSEGQNQQQDQQQQTVQTQQFPGQQQFPPEQRGPGFQRPGMNFPHAQGPVQQQTPQPQPNPQGTNAQPAQQQPLAPYGLALQPATPPRISFAGGQLTVSADNSSLTDILSNVMKITGAHLEGTRPPESDRVFGQFGPGTPRDVLNSLLAGSRYDYILIGGLDDPGDVRQVMLSQHGSSLQGVARAGNQASNEPNTEEEQENQENNEPAVIAQPEPPPPPPPAANNPSQPNPGQQQVKTPEQLLQELQRLRQQQQQQPESNPH